MAIDNNLFWNSQHNVGKLTWKLYSDGSTVGTNSNGAVGSNPNSSSLLLQGIIADPTIGMNISNEFDNNLGDGLGLIDTIQYAKNMVNGVNNTAAVIGSLAGTLHKEVENLKNSMNNNTVTKVADVITEGVGQLGRFGDIQVGTDYVQMYKGTRANYNIPNLTTIIYHGCIPGEPNMTVKQKLIQLANNIMGDYIGGTALGVFRSPNDYIPVFNNIGTEQHIPGTYHLDYGGRILKNLLITDFSFVESTFKVKGQPNETLYATVSVTLKQASVLVKDNVIKYLD